ncbi:efflux RND transporter periplasmic adaptor subunit [Pelagibaculum spongiae]|uniref:Efflux transporter periplasmic adaptor subunit n=1 Tax=Pelagibaculum spongiae TaxID=2080658 RepID=A0A2V1GNQ3_9GAMM|nr:efflux RND transporter periplasmic adaptor subunit [Pelagibaculum spongiae]PVZ63870.1 efflux transporter periplasmic adaptor subunit [Pelagibaculum spongiae]
MLKRILAMLAFLTILIGGIGGYIFNNIQQGMAQLANFAPPPVTVEAEKVTTESWSPQISATGSLRARNEVALTTQVSGQIETFGFSSGKKIEKGQLIVKLDDRVEQAQLKNSHASLRLMELQHQRDRDLFKRKVISKNQFDQSLANLDQASAQVEQLRAVLAKKQIHAPFSGEVGIRQVDLGDYLSPGSTIATLQDSSSLLVDFALPEKFLALLKLKQKVSIQVQAWPEKSFEGQITAIDAKVSATTRNISLRAELNNKEGELLPGMFANIKVTLDQNRQLMTVAQTSISYSSYGDTIWVLREEVVGEGEEQQKSLKAFPAFVQTGESRNGRISVIQGINAGDLVASSGQLKLYPGATVILPEQNKAEKQ